MNKEHGIEKYIRRIQPKYFWLVAFVLTAITYTMTFSYMGMLSNGKYIIARSDLKQQYIPFIQYFCSVLRGEHSYWYSWSAGLGDNTSLTFAYYTLSPFNIFFLILGDELTMTATALVIILKAATSAATFQIFIKKFWRKNYYETVLFSMMYALCGFQVCYYFNIIWMDAMYMLPVIAIGIMNLVKKEKTALLTVAYAYIFGVNFYIGYITGVSTAILFLAYDFWYWNKRDLKTNIKSILLYARSVIIAALLMAFIWLPAGIQLFNNIEPGYEDVEFIKSSVLTILNNLFLGEMQTLYGITPFVYSGLLTMMMLPFFFFNHKITVKVKVNLGSVVLIFCFLFLVEPLNKFMHAFDHPEMFAHRFSFVFSFILLVIASRQFLYLRDVKKIQMLLLFLFFSIIFAGSYLWYDLNVDEKYNANTICSELLNIIFILFYAWCIKKYKDKKMTLLSVRTLITFFLMLELGINAAVCMNRMDHSVYREDSDEAWNYLEESTVNKIKKENEDEGMFYRILYLNARGQNKAFIYDYPSVSFFNSAVHVDAMSALEKLGFYRGAHMVRGTGSTPITRMLLGIKYTVNGQSITSNIDSNEYFQTYVQNPDALSLGYMVDDAVQNFEFTDSPFDNQDNLLTAMTGEDIRCFTRIGMKLDVENGIYLRTDDATYLTHEDGFKEEGKFVYHVEDNGYPVYIYLKQDRFIDSIGSDEIPTIETFATESVVSDSDVFTPRLVPTQIVELGKDGNDEYSFTITLDEEVIEDYYVEAFFYEYDEEEKNKAYNLLEKQQLHTKVIDDGYLEGSVSAMKNGVLFLSIPYDEGWTAHVDGKVTEIIPLLGNAFSGIKLDTGYHEILLEYKAVGSTEGWFISVVTGCVMVLFYTFGSIKTWRNKISCVQRSDSWHKH